MDTKKLVALLETKLVKRLSEASKGYNVVYRDKAFDKTYTAQIPPGISKAEIVKMLKKTIRVGLEVISIQPMKEQFKLDKEKFTKPDQMRMYEEVFDVFGYKTKDFDICPGAVSLYKGIVAGDHSDGTPSPEMQEVIVKSAKLHDMLFKLEKDVLENGGTEEDIAKAQRIADAIMKIADKLDLTGEHNYVQGHIDKITKKVKGEDVNESAPGYKHDCASKVVHETYGKGTCIPEKHTLIKEGNKYVVTHYDVLFENGKTVHDIPVEELKIVTQNEHWHKNYKKKKKKKNEANVNVNRSTEIEVDGEIYEKHRGKWHGPSRGEVYKSSEMKDIIKKAKKVNVLESVNEAVNPIKAANTIFDKLAASRLIGKQYRVRAVSVIANMLKNMKLESVNEANYKVAGRPVKVNQGKKADGTDWTVTFKNGKTTPLSDVLALIKPFPKGIKEGINEDRFGHPITAQGNQAYIQVNKLLKMLSGKEKRDAEKAFNKMWPLIKSAMEAEESK